MIDICSVFRYIEQECQKPEIIAPDILKYRVIAINKLNMMADMPYPGGREEKINPSSTEGGNSSSRRVRNTNVTTMGRSTESIRTELIQSAKNYLEERLDDEQSFLLQSIINLTSSKTAAEFIAASLPLFDVCNVDDKDAFISSVLEHFDDMRPSSDIPSEDYGVKIYIMLRGSKSLVTEFLSSFCVVSLHSMSVERCVSTYNICYSDRRTYMEADTMNDRL